MKGETRQTTHIMRGEHAPLVAAAHELKSPLTLMSQLTKSLADTEFPLSEAQRRQYLERLQFTSDRMLRLLQQFTVSYRYGLDEQMAFDLQLEPINAKEICETALHELEPFARARGQQLRLVSRGRCPHIVLAERTMLHDVIVNLLDNAIIHNPDSAIVDLQPQCRGGMVRLTVKDNGVPVAESELRQLHKTLGQQLQPFSGRSGTSGLGLYIVAQLAKAMGGNLGVGRSSAGASLFVDLMRSRQLTLL